jgi:hypothetical protein
MNDAARIRQEHRDWQESRRNPRGCRLTQQPMNANNLGSDYRPLPGTPPIKPEQTNNNQEKP